MRIDGTVAQKFCVMTVGRSGSTSLMETIRGFEDVAVPGKDIDCEDDELLHPRRLREQMKQYAALAGRPIRSPRELIDAFYARNEAKPYAGFKSMPNRHPDYAEFTARRDIRFITLQRRDYASTAASFLRASDTGSWRRHGEPRGDHWRFDPKRDGERLKGNLAYIRRSRAQLDGIPGAIHLWYEDLCRPDYASPELDEFFGRAVRFSDPRPPTTGASYVENWDEFREAAERLWKGGGTGFRAFCVVLGGARSGASVLGALLDAHPSIALSREADVLLLARKDLPRGRLFDALLEGARRGAAGRARVGPIPGQWQGRLREPRVIGGVAGDAGAAEGAGALERLRESSGLALKAIHVVRNPVDVVSLLSARLGKPVSEILAKHLEASDNARKLLKPLGETDRLELRYEDLLADPARELRGACAFLGLPAPDDYLQACTQAVLRMPRDERPPVPWTRSEADELRGALRRFGFFASYSKRVPEPAGPARVRAGCVFYAWELGMDLGHLLRFLGPALKLRERGHEVMFAVRDLSNAESTLGRHGFALMQAPIWIALTPAPGAPLNYAEIILRYGFLDYPGLKALVKAWRELFRHARPGIVLADHSPTALLAARTLGLKRAPIGSGFFNPPMVKPLPPMRYWQKASQERLERSDAIATRNANRVIADLGGAPLGSLADLFRGDENFLCTFEELDHYRGRGPSKYWGPTFELEQGTEAAWPEGAGKCVFAYVKARYRDFAKILEALAGSGCRVLAYAPGISREHAARYSSPRMTISREPLRLKRILKSCDLAICHGGPGTVTAALLSGVPLLLLPTQLEQFLTARRIDEMRTGIYVDMERRKPKQGEKNSDPDYPALIRRLLEEPGFRAKAREFAAKYRKFSPESQAHAIATRIEQLIQG